MKVFVLLAATWLVALGLPAGLAGADDKDDDAKLYQAARDHLPKAKLTLADAIKVALQKHAGGHAIEGGFEAEGDDYDFVIEVSAGDKLYDVEVDAITGTVESDEAIKPEADEQTAAVVVGKSKVTLAKAVAAAVEAVGKDARAFDAGPHVDDGKLIYEIGLLSGKDIYDVQVDGATGKVLAKRKAE